MSTEKHDNCCSASSGAANIRTGEGAEERLERMALESRMGQIKHKILVLSGKGGVGKSTVAVNLATALAMAGKKVGLLDVDLHGPSVPKLLQLENETLTVLGDSLLPVKVEVGEGALFVMSIGFMLQNKNDAVIWRGPRKHGLIKQFLKDVEWGPLDYLVVDSPPGTGDEPLAIAQLIENADGAIVVTTPQEVAIQDVRRSIVFCRELHLKVIGVVENMRGFACPKCGEVVDIFGEGGGEKMAAEMDVPYLCAIPIEQEVVRSGEGGMPIVRSHSHSKSAQAFGRMVRVLLESELQADTVAPISQDGMPMKIAIPVTAGMLSSHFGHCEHFVLYDVGEDGKSIIRTRNLTPPPHEPGTFPKWLHERGATVIIAGGMGSRAQSLFQQNNIQTVVGASSEAPDKLVRQYLDGVLTTGANACDH